MRHVRSDKCEVEVRTNEDRRAYFANLMTCGSVWACPVCAAKIQQVRAEELRRAIDTWTEQGGQVYMATYTVPHTRSDSLETLLSQFNEAQRKLCMGKPWKRLTAAHGISGQVKGLEVTWGQASGWHPHAHVIYFLEQEASPDLAADLFQRWQSATARAGFGELSRRAFTLQDAAKVRTYLTKMGQEYLWNAEHELVKSMSKRGRGSRYTPFDMLRTYLEQPDDGQMLALFAEYAYTFHGRNQLTWSRGLKKRLLNTEGCTDQQVADSIGEHDPVLARITLEQWRVIKRWNMQGTVLQVATDHGRDGLEYLLHSLDSKSNSERLSRDALSLDSPHQR